MILADESLNVQFTSNITLTVIRYESTPLLQIHSFILCS